MALHKRLAHLTLDQVDDLIKRYYEGERLASLMGSIQHQWQIGRAGPFVSACRS